MKNIHRNPSKQDFVQRAITRRLASEDACAPVIVPVYKSMYSTTVLDHLENPRNVGEMPDASARGTATNPVCGDMLHLDLKISDDVISAASFKVQGCPPSIAAASVLTEMLRGLTLNEALLLTPTEVTRALESLPRNKEHCSVLAIDSLRAAIKDYQRNHQ